MAFHPAGEILAATGIDNAVRLWRLPKPVQGSRSEVVRLVEALTGQHVEAGGVRKLSERELSDRRQALAASGLNWPEP